MTQAAKAHPEGQAINLPGQGMPFNQAPSAQMMMGFQIQQSPMPSGEMLDGLVRHIPDVGPRWMAIFESQVKHEQDMNRENLRVNETLNNKNLDIQAENGRGERHRVFIAQMVAGLLLLLGLVSFVGLVGFSLWFFAKEKNLAGSVSLAISGAIGYFFRSVVLTYFPGKSKA